MAQILVKVIFVFFFFFLMNPVRVKLQSSLRSMCFVLFCVSTYFLESFLALSWPVRRAYAAGLWMAAVIVAAPQQIKEDTAVFDEVHLKSVDVLRLRH